MIASLRRNSANLATSGAHLLLLYAGYKLESRIGWLVCLGLMAFISLFGWILALRRLRMVRDTPTSSIASAAQGYVELIGIGKPLTDQPLLSKLNHLPCLWYRYMIEHESRDSDGDSTWVVDEQGESDEPFLIDDGSGHCVIDPFGAEIMTQHKDVTFENNWLQKDRRFTEWRLLADDTIYAIGQFRTFGGSSVGLSLNEEVKNVLAEWKQDMPDLHERFDLNNDGELDMQEWMLARSAAKREAEKRITAARTEPDVSYLLQPKDGRLFLISNLPQDELEHRYGFWTGAHLIILFSSLAGFGWVYGHMS